MDAAGNQPAAFSFCATGCPPAGGVLKSLRNRKENQR
jgi:hypothetical protein